jgi:PAS domain S-box-containing protein
MPSSSPTRPNFAGDQPRAAAPGVLVDRNELASVALERTRMPIVITDARQAENPIVLANQAFLDLSGYADDEIIGRNCRFLQGPETSPDAIDRVRAAVAKGESLTVELLNYRKDGSKFWNQLYISPIRDKDGRVIYFFASQVDVTDSYRARELQASEHRLLREVDHRAMNALALVQAIVRLSRTESVERYAEIVQGRVGALARAHVLLAQGGWKGADLDRLVRAELQIVSAGDVDVEGGGVLVSSEHVQPLLLVLHEMADDVVRNGALAETGGALRVRCWRDEVGGRQGFEWRETGGPKGAAGRTPEFASFLVTTLVERQLKGAIAWREGADGLEVDVRLPWLA